MGEIGELVPNLSLGFVRVVKREVCVVFDEVNCIFMAIKLDLILDKVQILAKIQLPSSIHDEENLNIFSVPGLKKFKFVVSVSPSSTTLHGGYCQIVELDIENAQKGEKMEFKFGSKIDGFLVKKINSNGSKICSLGRNKVFKEFKIAKIRRKNSKIVEISLFENLQNAIS